MEREGVKMVVDCKPFAYIHEHSTGTKVYKRWIVVVAIVFVFVAMYVCMCVRF